MKFTENQEPVTVSVRKWMRLKESVSKERLMHLDLATFHAAKKTAVDAAFFHSFSYFLYFTSFSIFCVHKTYFRFTTNKLFSISKIGSTLTSENG